MRPMRLIAVLFFCLASLVAARGGVTMDGTAFTYQGRLSDGGEPIDEAVDLEFTLHDSAIGGAALGNASLDDVPVSGGVFAVALDFGPVFDGNQRWLEVSVRLSAAGGSFTTLQPRQLIQPTPSSQFAMMAASVEWGAIEGVPMGFADGVDDGAFRLNMTNDAFFDGGNVGVGTNDPGALLDVVGSQGGRFYVTDTPVGGTGAQVIGRFQSTVGGASLRLLAPTASRGGSISSDLILSPDGTVSLGNPADERLAVDRFGNVGVGTFNPLARFHVSKDAPVLTAGVLNPNAAMVVEGEQSALELIGTEGASALSFKSTFPTKGGGLALGSHWALVRGVGRLDLTRGFDADPTLNPSMMTILQDGRVGIGTDAPLNALVVRGNEFGTGNSVAVVSSSIPGALAAFELADDGFALWSFAKDGANQFTISSGPDLLVRMLQSGEIGVGTANPTAQLDVRRDASGSTTINAENSGTGPTVALSGTVNTGYGVYGESMATGSSGNYGVYGVSNSPAGFGVFSQGRFGSAGTKSFMIDHPTDPEEMYLLHYSMESPEPQNVYNGVAVMDGDGQAWVRLPDYFESINADYRYTLTPIGEPALLYVKQKIRDNAFLIAGGAPGMEVSWEVKARRADRFVERMGAPVEVRKGPAERGLYLMPELYDQPREKGVNHRPADAASNGVESGEE